MNKSGEKDSPLKAKSVKKEEEPSEKNDNIIDFTSEDKAVDFCKVVYEYNYPCFN